MVLLSLLKYPNCNVLLDLALPWLVTLPPNILIELLQRVSKLTSDVYFHFWRILRLCLAHLVLVALDVGVLVPG